jgi:hypothetical protein
MSYKEVFEKDGEIIVINKDIGECRTTFLIRAHFILRNLNISDIDTIVKKSYLYINIYVHKQKFNSNVENSLKGYDCSLT